MSKVGLVSELENKKNELKYQEEYLNNLKNEIKELENKITSSNISQLEIEFDVESKKVYKEIRLQISKCKANMIAIGKKNLQEKVEEISERTGVPVHLSHLREFELNSLYVPKSAKDKWPKINFSLFDTIHKDFNFGGGSYEEGWYHSSVC